MKSVANPSMSPRDEPPRNDRLAIEGAADAEQLDHDVEDRAGGQRQERDRDGLADPRLAEEGAEEGRAATDQADEREEAPARTLPAPENGPTMPNPSVAL